MVCWQLGCQKFFYILLSLQCFDTVGRQEGQLACKNWAVGCWRGCLERGADLHMAQRIPLPLTVSVKSRLVFTFLVPAHPGSPGQRAVKCVCVCIKPNNHHFCISSKENKDFTDGILPGIQSYRKRLIPLPSTLTPVVCQALRTSLNTAKLIYT